MRSWCRGYPKNSDWGVRHPTILAYHVNCMAYNLHNWFVQVRLLLLEIRDIVI